MCAHERPGAVVSGRCVCRWAGVLVAPLVFRVQRVLSCGPGCFVCPWAAARPRDIRAVSFARRVVAKPGQAPPPPIGTAVGPSGALLCPPRQWDPVCWRVAGCVASLSGQAPPPPMGAAAWPSGALHASGAFVSDVARRVSLMPSYG